jgi:hypothetical protein
VEPFPFTGDPSLAQESKVTKFIEIAKAAGEAGEKTGKFQQNLNINKDMIEHVGAAAQEQGLVKRYKLSRGMAGGHTYLIVYTGPVDGAAPAEETPKPAKPVQKPREVVEPITPEPAEKLVPQQAAPAAKPRTAIRTKPLPAKVAPKAPIKKVNGSGSNDLLAGFFG